MSEPVASATVVPSDPNEPAKLPRLLGLFDATAVVVGSIIGSGIASCKPGASCRSSESGSLWEW